VALNVIHPNILREAAMAISADDLEVSSFETTVQPGGVSQPYTAPIPNCYSPLCVPTWIKEQCPETGTVAPPTE
jgi:hypothetical protein